MDIGYVVEYKSSMAYISQFKVPIAGICEVSGRVFCGSLFFGKVRSGSELLILITFGLRGWEGGFFISHKQHS